VGGALGRRGGGRDPPRRRSDRPGGRVRAARPRVPRPDRRSPAGNAGRARRSALRPVGRLSRRRRPLAAAVRSTRPASALGRGRGRGRRRGPSGLRPRWASDPVTAAGSVRLRLERLGRVSTPGRSSPGGRGRPDRRVARHRWTSRGRARLRLADPTPAPRGARMSDSVERPRAQPGLPRRSGSIELPPGALGRGPGGRGCRCAVRLADRPRARARRLGRHAWAPSSEGAEGGDRHGPAQLPRETGRGRPPAPDARGTARRRRGSRASHAPATAGRLRRGRAAVKPPSRLAARAGRCPSRSARRPRRRSGRVAPVAGSPCRWPTRGRPWSA
jgi:hypothetical protein